MNIHFCSSAGGYESLRILLRRQMRPGEARFCSVVCSCGLQHSPYATLTVVSCSSCCWFWIATMDDDCNAATVRAAAWLNRRIACTAVPSCTALYRSVRRVPPCTALYRSTVQLYRSVPLCTAQRYTTEIFGGQNWWAARSLLGGPQNRFLLLDSCPQQHTFIVPYGK